MLLQDVAARVTDETYGYAAAASLELCGKQLELKFAGKDDTTLAFAQKPALKLSVDNNPAQVDYSCLKIGARVYLVWFTNLESSVSFVLDLDSELVTRISTDSTLKSVIDFGSFGKDGKTELQGYSKDLGGNTVFWTFGELPSSRIKAVYEGDAVAVSAEAAPGAITVEDYSVVRISEIIYLQNALVKKDGKTLAVNLVSNFGSVTSAGNVFEVSLAKAVKSRAIGAYGRIVSD
ncbi:MAG: hypothetical protein LBN00_05180 [Oscillospiraceae bacterium]|jgi:hypothetical protein|nr:hypothetical protein [Oscillospiraceae bacterium]